MDEIVAPSTWRRVAFISDLHLQPDSPRTHDTWSRWMNSMATEHAHASARLAHACDALFILGDLFEVWVGDDILTDGSSDAGQFAKACMGTIRRVAEHIPVYFMAGNRDFLLGPAAAKLAGITLLPDPCSLAWHDQRYLLSHGDAWCLEDHAYMQFREQVRNPAWQTAFLARPLAERLAIAQAMRNASEAQQSRQQHEQGAIWADLDDEAVLSQLHQHRASNMIHGHTHRPGIHVFPDTGCQRTVLSDWDLDHHHGAASARAEVLFLDVNGHVLRQSLCGDEASLMSA